MNNHVVCGDQRIVVAGFIYDDDEVLLAKRSSGKLIAPGKYHLPGGHVEFAENPASALKRELKEELNIEVSICEPLWVFDYMWQFNHTVGIVFRVPFHGKHLRESLRWETDDIEDCIWVKEEVLGGYLSPEDHNYVAALAGFRALRQFSESKHQE